MPIICPYCTHFMSVKAPRAGRFTPRCARCGKTFALLVTLTPEPAFQATPLPGTEGQAAAFDPNLTAPTEAAVPGASPAVRAKPPASPDVTAPLPAETSAVMNQPTVAPEAAPGRDADFSVASSVRVREASAAVDRTSALEQTGAPAPRRPAQIDATEAEGAAASADDGAEVPRVLGGYQIVKELGRGGMGAVYLARQVSLDRPVALKTMRSEWASNPNFVVRFTREAYAAAQLVHHNVVQVYDIGSEKGLHYFSMEFVEGCSLGDLLKKDGRLDPATAAGYILQAARGLKFAHDRGMIHRDIKPDNLMLNTQGVVKVADLGLVRTPGIEEKPLHEEAAAAPVQVTSGKTLASLSNITLANQAMGTPAYMAPEQARDATRVDHRADIYSLGCTLYVLLTGRPVFQGSNALEVMTRHAKDAAVRPEQVVKEVPKALSDIVLKMIAKKPEDRYASMDEVIAALEAALGLHGQSTLDRAEQHLRTLESGVKAFLKAPAAGLRSTVLLGFHGGLAAIFLVLLLSGAWTLAGAVLGLGLATTLAYFVVHGTAQRGYLFSRVRDHLLSSSWGELGRLLLGALLFLGVLALLGQLGLWVLAVVLGVGLALGMHYSLDRRLARQRAAAVEPVEHLLKTLRLRGLSEEALHEFVCRHAGDHWEEFFEALFGYEAKLAARLRYGAGPKGSRPRFAAWRDPLVRWIDARQRARQEARERRHLQAIEQKNLEGQGVSAAEARARAEAMAEAMVQKAGEIKKEAAAPLPDEGKLAPEGAVKKAPPPRRVNVQDLFDVLKEPPKPTVRPGRLVGKLAGTLFGSGVRFTVGAALLLVCLLWLQRNGLLPSSSNADDLSTYRSIWERLGSARPLVVPLPEVVLEALCSINAGAAGLLLLLSAIWRSWKIGLLTLLGAALMVIGPVSGQVPPIGPLSAQMTCLAGGGLVMLLGFWLGRDT